MDPIARPDGRSQAKVLLQTFALRMAVATAYGHLGTLQSVPDDASTTLARMAKLLLLPGLVIFQFAGQVFDAFLVLMGQKHLTKIWRLDAAVAVLLGLRVHVTSSGNSETGHVVKQTYAAKDLDPSCMAMDSSEADKDPRSSALVSFGRSLVQLAFLAQSAASFVLVVRRFEIPGAVLLLDWVNSLYAVVGICTAINSIGIIALGGRRARLKTGSEAIGLYEDVSARVESVRAPTIAEMGKLCLSTYSLLMSACMHWNSLRVLFSGSPLENLTLDPVLSIVWTVSLVVFAISPVKTGIRALIVRVSIVHQILTGGSDQNTDVALANNNGTIAGESTDGYTDPSTTPQRNGKSLRRQVNGYGILSVITIGLTLWSLGKIFLATASASQHVLLYAALLREQILIGSASGGEFPQAPKWWWADPWSERLFIY